MFRPLYIHTFNPVSLGFSLSLHVAWGFHFVRIMSRVCVCVCVCARLCVFLSVPVCLYVSDWRFLGPTHSHWKLSWIFL